MVTTLKTIGPSKTKSRNSKNSKVTTPLKASPDTIQPHYGPLLDFAREKVETRGCVDLMTTFDQGRLSRSFTIRFLNVDADTSYFALISWKMLSELGAIVSTPHLKMKFPTLTGEIVTVKADQKQARQCYDESLKVAPHPSTRESGKPHPTSGGSSQVMNIDEESSIRTLVVYKATRRDQDDVFDVDLYGNTINKGPIPIEELVKLQLGPEYGQCTQLSRDLTSHKSSLGESRQTHDEPSSIQSSKAHQTQVLPLVSLVKPKTDASLVESLKAYQTQGPSLVSLDKSPRLDKPKVRPW
ncbi:hypothetical protein JHK87_049993 [Glycine soja]|nr:hypothetical protein JHK87_049993 [Glycine soja]